MGGVFGGLWTMPGSLSPLEQATLQRIMDSESDRFEQYAAAWDAYHGLFKQPLGPATDGQDDSVRLNKCKTIVDTATGLLFGNGPTWDLPGDTSPSGGDVSGAPEQETPDEEWLEDCLAANRWPQFLVEARTNGACTGDAYAKVLPPQAPRYPYPRLQCLDSSAMTIRWNPRDLSDVQAYIWQANLVNDAGKPIIARQLVERQDNGTWRITDQEHSLSAAEPQQWVTTGVAAWDYPWPPIIHCNNLPRPNEVYGDPDLTANLIRLNESLNFQYSNDSRVQHYQGHPILYGTGLGPNTTLDISPDFFNALPGDAKLGQLAPQIEHAAAQQLRKELQEAIDEESRTPAAVRGRSESGNPSGVALRIAFWPMDMKIGLLRTLYQPFLTEIVQRLLELGGKGPDREVVWTWPQLLPVDPLEERQALLVEQQMGVTSRATIAGALGRDWTAEQENLKAEEALAPQVSAALAPTSNAVDPLLQQKLASVADRGRTDR